MPEGRGSQLIPRFICPRCSRILLARAVPRGLGHLEKAAVRCGWTHTDPVPIPILQGLETALGWGAVP